MKDTKESGQFVIPEDETDQRQRWKYIFPDILQQWNQYSVAVFGCLRISYGIAALERKYHRE